MTTACAGGKVEPTKESWGFARGMSWELSGAEWLRLGSTCLARFFEGPSAPPFSLRLPGASGVAFKPVAI